MMSKAGVRADFRRKLLDSARDVGKGFTRPDDDWLPVFIFQDADGQVTVVGIDPVFLRDDETKERLAWRIAQLIWRKKAVRVGMVASCWSSDTKALPRGQVKAMIEGRIRPCQDPLRKEVLMVAMVDDETTQVHQAEIKRHSSRPPKLGQWEIAPETGGRWIELLQAGLALARKPGVIFPGPSDSEAVH